MSHEKTEFYCLVLTCQIDTLILDHAGAELQRPELQTQESPPKQAETLTRWRKVPAEVLFRSGRYNNTRFAAVF
jgi:hypothetical protein